LITWAQTSSLNNTERQYMKKRNAGDIDPETLGFLAIIAVILTAIISFGMLILAGTPLGPHGYLGNLLLVVRANIGFWIVLVMATAFGFYRKLSNPDEFAWYELPIQLAVSTLGIILLSCFFFSTSTHLTDTEIMNGYVTGAEYHEAWTERVVHTSTDKKGRTKTWVTYDKHEPYWTELTTVGDLSIDRSLYQTFVRYFSNERKKNLYHSGQSSIGDGNMYYVSYDAKQEIIPASRPQWFVNYLRASDSIKKIHGSVGLYKDLLRPYPSVYSGTYGEIEIDRVIEAGVTLPQQWKNDVDKTLDLALTHLGQQKEVNILVYAVNTADEGFVHALEESWVKCKQNDVIVILGVPEFPKISFAYITAWTKIEEFRINLRNKIIDSGDLNDGVAFANIITQEISKSPEQGGFKRMPMSDLEYLIADIRLPWWCQFLIVLVGGGISWVTSTILINNQYRE